MPANWWRRVSLVRALRVAPRSRAPPRSPIWRCLMARRLTSRLSLAWLLSLCVLVGLAAPGGAGAATSSSGCDNRVNDTPGKLVPCVTQDDLWNHMKAFQAIADANPGTDGHP